MGPSKGCSVNTSSCRVRPENTGGTPATMFSRIGVWTSSGLSGLSSMLDMMNNQRYELRTKNGASLEGTEIPPQNLKTTVSSGDGDVEVSKDKQAAQVVNKMRRGKMSISPQDRHVPILQILMYMCTYPRGAASLLSQEFLALPHPTTLSSRHLLPTAAEPHSPSGSKPRQPVLAGRCS